jgi:hypothetical protein
MKVSVPHSTLTIEESPWTERSESRALDEPLGSSEEKTFTVKSVLNRVRLRLFMFVQSVDAAYYVKEIYSESAAI